MGITGKIHLGRTRLYRNCSELMLFNYIEATCENNLRYLVRSGPMPSNEKLRDHLTAINEEFSELRGETTNKEMRNDILSYKEQLILKVHTCWNLLHRLETRINQKLISPQILAALIEQLKGWGFRMNPDAPLREEMENIANELRALQTTIDAMQAELFPENNETMNAENNKFQFYSILLAYQRILDIGKINIKKTSLLEFAVLEKSVKETIKRKENQNG